MTKHVSPKPALWPVLVGVGGTLWMLWEVVAHLAGWGSGTTKLRYPVMLVCLFGYSTWLHYRRWKNAHDGMGEPLAST